jgi:hypothetical protein
VYVLESWNGDPLPVTWHTYTGGHTDVVSGTMRLETDGTYRIQWQNVEVTTPSTNQTLIVEGRYTFTATELSFDDGAFTGDLTQAGNVRRVTIEWPIATLVFRK